MSRQPVIGYGSDGLSPDLRREIGEVATSTALKWFALEGRVARPFSYLLHGFKTTPESFFSCWVKSTLALSRVNPAKLIAVLAAVARAARPRTCDCFGVRSIWWVTNYRLRTKPDQLIGNAKAHHSAQTG
jgi:hypothetical protein